MARAKKERITQPHWINMANGIDVIDKGGTLYVNSMEKFWEVLNAYVDNLWRNSHFAGYNLCNYYGYQHVIEFKVLESKNGKRKCSISQNAG